MIEGDHGEHVLGRQGWTAPPKAVAGAAWLASGRCRGKLTRLQTLIVPALIALIGYLLLTFVAIPVWQRYRNRYGQYLPLETISNQTTSLRHRVQNAIGRVLVPSAWRQRLQDRLVIGADGGSDGDYDSDVGEELGDIDDDRRPGSIDSDGEADTTRRLSRE